MLADRRYGYLLRVTNHAFRNLLVLRIHGIECRKACLYGP